MSALFRGVVVLAALAFAAPAGAATYTTGVSPDPFSFSPSQQLVYRLHISTGGQAERIPVSAEAPSFPDAGPGFAYGGFFSMPERMTLEGSGTVLSSNVRIVVADRFCSPPFADSHGNGSSFTPQAEVEIPANTTSALVLPTITYNDSPWPGMSLAVGFRIGDTPGSEQVVLSSSPRKGASGSADLRSSRLGLLPLTRKAGLSLGDRACLALALDLGGQPVTAPEEHRNEKSR